MNQSEIEDKIKVLDNRTQALLKSVADLKNEIEKVKQNE